MSLKTFTRIWILICLAVSVLFSAYGKGVFSTIWMCYAVMAVLCLTGAKETK